MTDTPQPETAGETRADQIDVAADAFKAFGQTDEPIRDERGRFAPKQEEEIEADEPEADLAEGEIAESHDEEEAAEAAVEAQPDPVDLPTSWPAEHGETWNSLPPETQAIIREREGQRDAAINAKFQEAANLRKAHEAEINEANANRKYFADAAEFALSLVRPQAPPTSMLDPRSGDYAPDAYHLAKARYDESLETISAIQQQRQEALAQQEARERQAIAQTISQVEAVHFPKIAKDIPELNDPSKGRGALEGLARYAVDNGIPADVFSDPERSQTLTSAEFHMIWKAQQYDKMVAAKAKVQPKAAKPSAPPVRPGVTTPRSAVQSAKVKADYDRLARSGSVDDAAAMFKHIFKG